MKKILFLTVFLLLCSSCYAKEYGLTIHFIDTGEGESILIQNKDISALIDAGGLLGGCKLAQYLKKNKITTLKQLIITHFHPDHFMGLFFIIPKLKIENFYDNGFILDAAGDYLFSSYERIFRLKENYRILKEGDSLKLGDVVLKVLWPHDLPASGSLNHYSLVISLNYRGFGCLLAADIDKAAETDLLKQGAKLRVDVLKVAHHGSGEATSPEFLKKVFPGIAVISVDRNNRQGYPDKNTLDLLKENGIATYRTDECGTILIKANGKMDYVILPEKAK